METILIVNSMPIVRAGLRRVLESMEVASVLHEAGSADEARASLADNLGLVILDPEMPDIDLPELMKQLRQKHSQVPILFFGGRVGVMLASLAVQLGADGYLSKCSDEKTIVAAIQTLLGGMQCFPRQQLGVPAAKAQVLSHKEVEVLLLLRQGLRNKDVARRMYLSEKTISAHKHNILHKLGVSALAQVSAHEQLMQGHSLAA